MPTNRNPNPNATSNLSGWSKGGSSTTLTSTSEGARWVGGSSGTGRYVRIVANTGLVNTTTFRVGNISIRRNTGTARIMSVVTNDHRFPGDYTITTNTSAFALGSANFVMFGPMPFGNPQVGVGNWPDLGDTCVIRIDIFAEDNKPFDFHIKGLGVYVNGDSPAPPDLDSNDSAWTYTQGSNSLTVATQYVPGNEAVDTCTWIWGDGTANTTVAASTGTATHTYASAGIRNVSLKVDGRYGDDGGNNGAPSITDTFTSATQAITTPVGTFQAGFNYQSDYPQVLVDASSSVAPSLSPIQTYAWNWGDGTTGSGLTASHTYAAAGSYNVTLTVSNSTVARSSSITKSVTLSAPQLPVTAPQFALQLFLDDPASVVTSSGLQSEMVPIINADAIRWNWTRSEIPTMDFKVPASWVSDTLPGVTVDTLRSDIVLRINWGAGWYEPPSSRFIIDDIKVDPLNPQEMVTVSCVGIAADDLAGLYFTPEIAGGAYTAAEIADGYSRVYSNVKPGAVLVDLLPVASTPGTGAPHLNYMNIDFSATVDSKGVAWGPTLESLKVPADTSGLGLLQSLIDSGGIDWYCQKNLLRTFNPGTGGKRASEDAIPELLPGRDITSAPQRQSPIRSKCWGAVVIGDKKTPYVVSDTVSSNPSYQREAYRGRRYVAIQAGDAASSAAALALAKPSLASIYRTKDGEMVRELRFYSDMPWMPLRDYWVGDTVYAPGPDGKLITVNVESITLTQNSSQGVEGALILGNAYAVNSLASKVASLSGGSGISVGRVSSKTGTDWIPLTLSSGYTAFGGIFEVPAYRVADGRVYLRGVAKSTAATSAVATLAVVTNYGTPMREILNSASAGSTTGALRIDILPDGTLSLQASASNTVAAGQFISLTGLSWDLP